MKPTKDMIFEFIQQNIYTNPEYAHGIETRFIAEALGMQRSNVSTLLNKLVSEEKLVKSITRPVLYRLPDKNNFSSEEECFSELVGENGSLCNAIQLAKAAILYPQKSLNVLLSSKAGCGTTFFATLMHKFAINSGVLKKEAPFVKINCRHYAKNISILYEELFGKGSNTSCFSRAKGGMLFIDYFDMLDAKQQSSILTFLETGKLFDDEGNSTDYSDVYLILSCALQNAESISRKVPVTIELPELKNRPMKERLELINHFFEIEAQNSQRTIEVTTEAIKALLLSEYTYNIKELSHEIMSACANAYVRVIHDLNKDIYVCANDFSPKTKRSLLQIKVHLKELENLLGDQEYIIYDQNHGIQSKNVNEKSLYYNIQSQYNELSNQGVNQTSIETVINNHIKNLFSQYSYTYEDESNNYEQLSKIVDKKVINVVTLFLDAYKQESGKQIPLNIFYALCLHISSIQNNTPTHQRVNNDQIVMTIQNYPKEYAAAAQFASVLKQELGLELDIAEVVIITMFLIEPEENEEENKPVLLYIMHGNTTARSLCEVTNALTHCNNAYCYDLKLDSESSKAMEEIKELIQRIDRGEGVVVIYDMGSIKTMIDAISEEIDVKIRCINIPVTLIGIDIARKCSMESDIDVIYHNANRELNNARNNAITNIRNNAIITLCHTGEGGAMQLKNYIDSYSKLNMKTIALSITDRNELIKEVMDIKRTYNIHAFIGTYDPKLLGIPFISIADIFSAPKENLDRILQFELTTIPSIDYSLVYNLLEEQFKYTSISKLKIVLPSIVDELTLMYSLNSDQALGIFVHLGCVVERILSGGKIQKNPETSRILNVLEDDCKTISKILKRLEKTFKIVIDDNELVTLVMMVKKI